MPTKSIKSKDSESDIKKHKVCVMVVIFFSEAMILKMHQRIAFRAFFCFIKICDLKHTWSAIYVIFFFNKAF